MATKEAVVIKRSFRCEKCGWTRYFDHTVGKKVWLQKNCIKSGCKGKLTETETSKHRMKEKVTKVRVASKIKNNKPVRCKGCGALFSGGVDMLGNNFLALHLSFSSNRECRNFYEELGFNLARNEKQGYELTRAKSR